MTDVHTNGNHAAQVGGGKATNDDNDRLKKKIVRHYDMSAGQFLKVWGEHIHHGYFKSPTDTADESQVNQVLLLAELAGISAGSRVLDIGCGIGGTARFLARERGCKVTAITNSQGQVELARQLTATEAKKAASTSQPPSSTPKDTDFVQLPSTSTESVAGAVRILHLDVDKAREHLGVSLNEKFDCIWMSEVIFHLHTRQSCFDTASALLESGGCFVIADIFRTAPDPASASKRVQKELASIRRNHLCPELGTVEEYKQMAEKAGLRLRQDPKDITKNVAKTWETSVPLSSVLYLITQGRDAIGYLRGMQSMKRAYAHDTAMYAVLCFEKP